MANLHRLPDSSENRKTSSGVLRGVGKGIAALALALGAQIGSISQPSASQAAEPVHTRAVKRLPEAPALATVEKDIILADEAHTIKGGVSFILGVPVLVMPVSDPATGQAYMLAFEDCTSAVPDGRRRISELGVIFGKDKLPDTWPDTPEFLSNMHDQLSKLPVTKEQKQRIHYATAYFWAAVNHWKSGDGQKVGLAKNSGESLQKFEEAVTSFKALNDNTPWFQERVKDFEIFRATHLTRAFWSYIDRPQPREGDTDNFLRSTHYTEALQRSAAIMQQRTAAYLAGKKPKSEFMMDVAIFNWMVDTHLNTLKLLPQKSLLADQRYQTAMVTTEAILPVLQQAFEAVGTGQELENKQQARYQVIQGQQLLGYQTFLAANGYHFPGISPAKMAEWANQNFTVAKEILDSYGAEGLGLRPDTLSRLTQERIAYAQVAGNYQQLADAADTGKRLRTLFARVLANQSAWSVADKAEFKQLYTQALQSSSSEAQQAFLAVLRENVVISAPKVVIQPFEETGLTQNIPLLPINREINGQVVQTFEHPVDTVLAEFEIDNRTPLNFPVTIVIRLPGADNAVIEEKVELQADKVATVSYKGHVSTTSSRSGMNNLTPSAQLVLNPKTVEVATRSWGELLASAE